MSQLDWQDVLNIGLPEIDEQHKELIGLSNGLIQAMINGMGQDVLKETIDELIQYTKTHFADEEAFMETIGYPHLDLHKQVHAKLTQEVFDFKDKLIKGESLSANDTLDFINDWIVNHIMSMDSKIGEFAKNR